MKTIVVASHNPGKIEEIRYILRNWDVKLIGLDELGFHDEIIEEYGDKMIGIRDIYN